MDTNIINTVQQLVTLLLVATAVLLAFALTLRRRRRRLLYPPGTKGLPLIGNMLMMDQLTHRGLARLAEKHGGLFHMKMGYLHMVVVSSPEVARQVLQVQDNVFSNRPATIAISYLTYDRADLVFANYGALWRQMRKLCVMKLFSRKRAESWQSVREEVHAAVSAVARAARDQRAVDIGQVVCKMMMDITYRAAFGASASEGQEEFVRIIQEFSELFSAFNIADFVPWLTCVDPQGLKKRLAEARAALDRFIDVIIEEHIEKKRRGGDHGEPDMVDGMLAFYSEEAAKGSESGEDLNNAFKLTRDNIKAIIMDVMFGGTETVASVIEWAMAELMHKPEELKKVHEELANVVGLHKMIDEADLEKLTYLKCSLKETLRLHPPVPLLLHETTQNAEVAGYHIPKKTRVMINVFAIGRDKSSWADPDTFMPARFLAEGVPDFKGGNFEFIPFGSGRRSCPGMQLGLYALELAVGHLLHCFTWELPNGMKPRDLDMSDHFGLTAPRATRLVGVPTKRVVCPI